MTSVPAASHSSGGSGSGKKKWSCREEMDFAHIETTLAGWQNRPYGEIATWTGLPRTRVRRAIKWAATNRDDIVVSAPIPGKDNRVRVVTETDSRVVQGVRHLGKHATTRTRNVGKRYEIAAKNHPDPTLGSLLADVAEQMQDAAKTTQRMQAMAEKIEGMTK